MNYWDITMLCLSLVDLSFTEIMNLLPDYELVELRLDRLELVESELQQILQRASSSLVCFPGKSETRLQRLQTLEKTLAWGASYIDCSIEDASSQQQHLILKAHSQGTKVLYSYHNYQLTPSSSTLQAIAKEAFSRGAEICKIVTMLRTEQDLQNLVSLYSIAPGVIAFGLGPDSTRSRMIALEKGAPFVYVALDDDHLAAPGQTTVAQMQEALREVKPELYAVCGSPILHSKSPQIFSSIFAAEGRSAFYFRILSSEPRDCLRLLQELKLNGINATSPLKEGLHDLVEDRDESAAAVRAVNCLKQESGQLRACNTDVFGIRQSLAPHLGKLSKPRLIILGAGGASRAAIVASASFTRDITVLNRSLERALALSQEYGVKADSLSQLSRYLGSCDILINTIPQGLDALDFSDLRAGSIVLDAIYANSILRAKTPAQIYIPGETWLINQALQAYKFFSNKHLNIPAPNLEAATIPEGGPIFLVGFMASGKSVVGRLLAQRLGYVHLDMDTILEQRMQKTISQCFEQDGEAHFRQLETLLLQELSAHKAAVISTGGGLVLDPGNREILKSSLSIWLYRDIKLLKGRKSESRPLLKGATPQQIEHLFETRKPRYAEVCSFMLHNRDVPQCSDMIYEEIRHYL